VSQLRIFVSADSENAAGARRRFRRVRGLWRHHGQLELDGGPDLHADQAEGRGYLSIAMDTEHRAIAGATHEAIKVLMIALTVATDFLVRDPSL
jgi:hypothetical protein